MSRICISPSYNDIATLQFLFHPDVAAAATVAVLAVAVAAAVGVDNNLAGAAAAAAATPVTFAALPWLGWLGVLLDAGCRNLECGKCVKHPWSWGLTAYSSVNCRMQIFAHPQNFNKHDFERCKLVAVAPCTRHPAPTISRLLQAPATDTPVLYISLKLRHSS